MVSKNLVEVAREEGFEKIVVEMFVRKESGEILLIEEGGFYGLPSALLESGETIQQALQRAVTLKTAMEMKEVVAYLGHYDSGEVRHFHFVGKVNDPYSLERSDAHAFAWLTVADAVGYPIRDELREMLDLLAKLKS
ncbi:MAG: hypothetical protein K1060chlam2_00767 [Chlamydiae bacterium]|nr:hypothetical protein [Chlamydiota bacterium]